MIDIICCTDSFALFIGAFGDYYNERCFKRTGVDDTPENRMEILLLHKERHFLFQQCRATQHNDYAMLAKYRDDLKDLEFNLQAAWGFDQNVNYHTYWFQLPHCACPTMDNYEYVGIDVNVITMDCPMHGDKSVNSWIDQPDVKLIS